MRRVLVIAHEPDGRACQIEHRLIERGYEINTHVVTNNYDTPNEAATFPSLDGYDLLVIMGSVRSLTNKDEIDAWVYDELELIRQAHGCNMPVLGICFGGQLIAEALGGSVEQSPVTEIGWYELVDGESGPNPVGPGPWMQWHHDRFIAPRQAEVLARTANAIQLIRIGRTVGTQFHPEVDVAHVEGFLETATDEYLSRWKVNRRQIVDDARVNEARNVVQCQRFVDWYLDEIVDEPLPDPTSARIKARI